MYINTIQPSRYIFSHNISVMFLFEQIIYELEQITIKIFYAY